MLGCTLGVDDGETLETDEGINLISSDGSFDGSNEGVIEGSFLGSTLGSTDSLCTVTH